VRNCWNAASVVATLRRMNALDDLKTQAGNRLQIVSLDVADVEAVRQVVDRSFADLGRVDVLVRVDARQHRL
jgi:NADP-dependent 3-hydroxy acid dehydrogenase YdfG